jgi:hypothetical protein
VRGIKKESLEILAVITPTLILPIEGEGKSHVSGWRLLYFPLWKMGGRGDFPESA